MSVGVQEQAGAAPPEPEGRAIAGRMDARTLSLLALGGIIGSGWLSSGADADSTAAGVWALGSWAIGGVLMLVVSVVMVELSVRAPKTGGLIFLPLQTGGPLLASVAAAGVWAYYAVTPPTESVAIVRNLAAWGNWPGLSNSATHHLTGYGFVLAAGVLALITVVNLLGPRRFVNVNNWLTGFKIIVPVLVVVLLLFALRFPAASAAHFQPPPSSSGQPGWSPMLRAVVGGGVLYSYLGFQGPIDFAGNVKHGGIGEAWRLRVAVYGTVIGSLVLYLALQWVFIYLRYHWSGNVDTDLPPGGASVYNALAGTVFRPGPLGWLAGPVGQVINLDSLFSPAGTALVFTYVMTREVAALSRAHLTHRGLQRSENSVFRPAGCWRFLGKVAGDDQLDVYKTILWVDFALGLFALVVTWTDWDTLDYIEVFLALLVYATPCITLAALCLYKPGRFPKRYLFISAFSFVAIAVVFVLSTGPVQWGIGTLAFGCLLLLAIPALFPGARWYDARAHWRKFSLRKNKAAQLATVLGGYFVALAVAETIRCHLWHWADAPWDAVGLVGVGVVSLLAFVWMVNLSARYMRENRPLLPKPFPGRHNRGTGGDAATGTGS